MKKTIRLSILCFLLFGLSSQTKAQSLFNPQDEVIKNEINTVFQEMLSFAENLNYDQLNKGVDDRYRAGFINNGKYYSSYASLIDLVKSSAQGVKSQKFSIKNKKITVLSDQLALLTASGISKITLDDGKEIQVTFYWSFVFEKMENSWKVIHSHQSSSN